MHLAVPKNDVLVIILITVFALSDEYIDQIT